MAMFDDLKSKKQRALKRKDGTLPPPVPPAPEPAPAPVPTKRIRMLRSFTSRHGIFRTGEVVVIERNRAAAWIGAGLAEEDKSFDQAPETK